jgi:Ca2+-binding RTX toxin-like protein
MVGRTGNDYFVIDSAGDSVVGGGGIDGIITEIQGYTLGSDFTALVLGNNVTSGTGNSGNNTLTGNSLHNTLNGGTGADTMVGDDGHDYYYIVNASDVVVEVAGQGTDTIEFTVTSYTLSNAVERLILGSGALHGTGNTIANTLIGNGDNNSLFGGAGRDSLTGGGGNDTLVGANSSVRNEIDTLTGGGGSDLFVLGISSGTFYDDAYISQAGTADYAFITDFDTGQDRLQLKSGTYYFVTASGGNQELFREMGRTDEMIARFQGTGFATTTFSNTSPHPVLSVTWV